jgi:hypothetical protein
MGPGEPTVRRRLFTGPNKSLGSGVCRSGANLASAPAHDTEMSETDQRTVRVQRIASTIERYVISRPNASDTIEGIRRWWLVDTSSEEDRGLLELALERLVDRGVMTKRALPDGKIVFSGKGSAARAGRECAPPSDEESR